MLRAPIIYVQRHLGCCYVSREPRLEVPSLTGSYRYSLTGLGSPHRYIPGADIDCFVYVVGLRSHPVIWIIGGLEMMKGKGETVSRDSRTETVSKWRLPRKGQRSHLSNGHPGRKIGERSVLQYPVFCRGRSIRLARQGSGTRRRAGVS